MQSSDTRAPLQPAPLHTHNLQSPTPETSRKRKRDCQSTPTFTARPIDATAKPCAVTFAPIVLVPRANVPLVWLAPAASYKTLASPYLFGAQLPSAWQHEGCALIARLTPNGGLYAVEKASPGSWVACRLASWVTEQDCHDATDKYGQLLPQDSTVRAQHAHTRSNSCSATNSGRPPTPCSPKAPKTSRGAQVRMSLFSSRQSQAPAQAQAQDSTANGNLSPGIATGSDDALTGAEPQLAGENDPKVPDKPPGPQPAGETRDQETGEVILPTTEPETVQQCLQGPLSADQIVQQYLETLYLSRTSLAFYAKGPLSRARAIAKSPDGGLSTEQLIECLYSCIVPAKKADAKYKASLPAAIKSLLSAVQGEEGASAKKKRACKKIKLGKDGLYNCESSVMEKWWRTREIGVCGGGGGGGGGGGTSTAEALERDIRHALTELRTRETQMQVLLILEVMALEAKLQSREAEIKQETDEQVGQTVTSPAKPKRRPRNLQTELDALIDRLCIWHTVSSDDVQLSTGKSDGLSGGPTRSRDELKEFYREIIKPFYGSKLPQQTKLLCEKLVGVERRPERLRIRPTSYGGQQQQSPAAAEQARPRSATHRTLERVLSDRESMRSESPPLLSRSSTLPILKREGSMSALRRVPSDLGAGPESRAKTQRPVGILGRQIDLVADAKAHQAKRQKMDRMHVQRTELRAVIEAIKKPNRSTVSKEIMDEVEQRKRVQITATPSRRKAMQLLKGRANLMDMADDGEAASEAEDDIVPSSTTKLSVGSKMLRPATAAAATRREPAPEAIACTPSKAATTGTSSSGHQLPSFLAATPVSKMNKSGRTVLFTPLKRNEIDVQDIFKDAPIIPEDAGRAMDRVMGGKGIEDSLTQTGTSIYERLGWDYEE